MGFFLLGSSSVGRTSHFGCEGRRFESALPNIMEERLTFKEMMHVASIQKGSGTIEELSKEIGAIEVDRLQQMKIIVSDGSDNDWKLSNIGWELVDLFNRRK